MIEFSGICHPLLPPSLESLTPSPPSFPLFPPTHLLGAPHRPAPGARAAGTEGNSRRPQGPRQIFARFRGALAAGGKQRRVCQRRPKPAVGAAGVLGRCSPSPAAVQGGRAVVEAGYRLHPDQNYAAIGDGPTVPDSSSPPAWAERGAAAAAAGRPSSAAAVETPEGTRRPRRPHSQGHERALLQSP